MEVGSVVGSDCAYKPDTRYRWSTPNTDVVHVTPDGLIRGRAPGRFKVLARRESVTLESMGFVLPHRWTLRVQPDSATLRVGDSARFEVVAVDSSGRALRGIPYSIFTPEFDRPDSDAKPLIDSYSYQLIDTAVVVRAVRAGKTSLRAQIGDRVAHAPLHVTPAERGGVASPVP